VTGEAGERRNRNAQWSKAEWSILEGPLVLEADWRGME
jgi:hypothetical protein